MNYTYIILYINMIYYIHKNTDLNSIHIHTRVCMYAYTVSICSEAKKKKINHIKYIYMVYLHLHIYILYI